MANMLLAELRLEREARHGVPQPSSDANEKTWQPAEQSGCSHKPHGSCIDCSDHALVKVPNERVVALEQAFGSIGSIRRAEPSEAPEAVPIRALAAGEVTWPCVFGMFDWVGARKTERFLDCGSGHGYAAYSLYCVRRTSCKFSVSCMHACT